MEYNRLPNLFPVFIFATIGFGVTVVGALVVVIQIINHIHFTW